MSQLQHKELHLAVSSIPQSSPNHKKLISLAINVELQFQDYVNFSHPRTIVTKSETTSVLIRRVACNKYTCNSLTCSKFP